MCPGMRPARHPHGACVRCMFCALQTTSGAVITGNAAHEKHAENHEQLPVWPRHPAAPRRYSSHTLQHLAGTVPTPCSTSHVQSPDPAAPCRYSSDTLQHLACTVPRPLHFLGAVPVGSRRKITTIYTAHFSDQGGSAHSFHHETQPQNATMLPEQQGGAASDSTGSAGRNQVPPATKMVSFI